MDFIIKKAMPKHKTNIATIRGKVYLSNEPYMRAYKNTKIKKIGTRANPKQLVIMGYSSFTSYGCLKPNSEADIRKRIHRLTLFLWKVVNMLIRFFDFRFWCKVTNNKNKKSQHMSRSDESPFR